MQKLPFDLKVGDYCFAYTKGVHRVVNILFPAEGKASTALVTLESVLDSNYKPRKGSKSNCDVAWCKKINKDDLLEQINNSHYTQINNVKELLI